MIGGITSLLPKKESNLTYVGSKTERQRMKDWEVMEKEMNKRMNIVGSNGNDGHHYWEDSWNEEYED